MMRAYMLIHWDASGSPTPLRLFMAGSRDDAITQAARHSSQYLPDEMQVSVTNGRLSWCGMIGDLFTLGSRPAWLGARPEETALLQACGGGL